MSNLLKMIDGKFYPVSNAAMAQILVLPKDLPPTLAEKLANDIIKSTVEQVKRC